MSKKSCPISIVDPRRQMMKNALEDLGRQIVKKTGIYIYYARILWCIFMGYKLLTFFFGGGGWEWHMALKEQLLFAL